ncbi:hypothetical protein ScalyP_jg10048 [Parmales sp. scaly parma]|nr:hypothetical protein ScalyP_jg10048 [Parmales sp. scaly parma]
MVLSLGSKVRVSSVLGDSIEYGNISSLHPNSTYSVTFSDRHSDHEIPQSRLTHLWDPHNPLSIQKGMKANCFFKDDNQYYPGTINEILSNSNSNSNSNFIFTYDDGDIVTASPPNLQLLPLPSLSSPTSPLNSPSNNYLSPVPSSVAVKIGDRFNALYSDGEYYEGTIHAVNSAKGTYVFYFDDGDVNDDLPRGNLRLLQVIESILDSAAEEREAEAEVENPYDDDFLDLEDSARESPNNNNNINNNNNNNNPIFVSKNLEGDGLLQSCVSNSSLNAILGVPVTTMYDDDDFETSGHDNFGKIDPTVAVDPSEELAFDNSKTIRFGGAHELPPRPRSTTPTRS